MTEKRSIERFLRRRSSRFAGTRSCLLGIGIFVMIGGQASPFTAYVSNEKSNTISVIDTDKFAVVKTIKVGQRPRGIGLTKDERFILVAVGDDDNTVTIIDLERRVPLGEVQVGVEPEGMGLSPDGKTLVATSETSNMAHF